MIIDDSVLLPKNNNLTAVRVLLASAVIWTHSIWNRTGVGGEDQVSGLFGQSLSTFAVDGFFFLSGFLVYGSLLRRANVGDFLFARFARLWPALAISVILTVMAGFFLTSSSRSSYLAGATLKFIASNLSLTFASFSLTGVRCGGTLCNVNGSLWTIPWEVRCYLLLAFLSLLGLARPKAMLLLILPATLCFALIMHVPYIEWRLEKLVGHSGFYNLKLIDRLWVMFALGIGAYLARQRMTLRWWPLLPMFGLMIYVNAFGRVIPHLAHVSTALLVLDLGFLSARRGAISGDWPDYSYGIYVYAFPVMMAVAAVGSRLTAPALAGFTLLASLPLAALSWHFLEAPALTLARRFRISKAEKLRPGRREHEANAV